MKFELAEVLAYWPAYLPMKLEADELSASIPAKLPMKLESVAPVAW
jgi:hypothetical protein